MNISLALRGDVNQSVRHGSGGHQCQSHGPSKGARMQGSERARPASLAWREGMAGGFTPRFLSGVRDAGVRGNFEQERLGGRQQAFVSIPAVHEPWAPNAMLPWFSLGKCPCKEGALED